jgi:hypothetical protein
MKTVKNNLFAIAFAITTVVALGNSLNTIMLSHGTGNIYIEAIDTTAYQQVAQAFDNSQPLAF